MNAKWPANITRIHAGLYGAVLGFSIGLAVGNFFAPLPDGGRQMREMDRLYTEVDDLKAGIQTLQSNR